MSKHIDYEEEAKFRVWWLNNTGGAARDNLTVRDYFAAKVICGCLGQPDFDYSNEEYVRFAFIMADLMMKERAK